MKDQFKVVKGICVPILDGISEGYAIYQKNTGYQMIVNVSAENIDNVFRRLTEKVLAPGFLVLEHGTNKKNEDELRKSKLDPFHKDVYYLDGLEWEFFLNIYNDYDDLLVNDGEISYGFGSHAGIDEVFVGPYKIFTIFTQDTNKYIQVLKDLGFRELTEMRTVWDNFSESSPGCRMTTTHNGIDIYKMVELLTSKGLYLAERRDE